ncbi:MAG TPA: hypothetical protein VK168_06970 [Saprospiraceae bacterium]|nr:hypothetical protein [Saprospiraceae bacterium]
MEPVQKAHFSPWDEQQVRTLYLKIPEKILINAGVFFIAELVITILPRRHKPLLWENYSLWGGLLLLAGLAAIISLLINGVAWFKLKKDLRSGFKIIRKVEVTGKERSYSLSKNYVWLGGSNSKFRHEVDDAVYESLEKGDLIAMEFAPFSHTLINIKWPTT